MSADFDSLELKTSRYVVTIINEPPDFDRDTATPPVRTYGRDHHVGDSTYRATSRHGVIVDFASQRHSALLSASGGCTGVHAHSALALEDMVLVAVCGFVAALRVPELELAWALEVDPATCFGIHVGDDGGTPAYFSHGELAIARFDLSGRELWSTGGADIFSEGFDIYGSKVLVTDFNGWVYEIDISSGVNLTTRKPNRSAV